MLAVEMLSKAAVTTTIRLRLDGRSTRFNFTRLRLGVEQQSNRSRIVAVTIWNVVKLAVGIGGADHAGWGS